MSNSLSVHFDQLVPPLHGSAKFFGAQVRELVRQGHQCRVMSLFKPEGALGMGQDLGLLDAPYHSFGSQGDVAMRMFGVPCTGPMQGAGRIPVHLWRALADSGAEHVLLGDEYGEGAFHVLRALQPNPRPVVIYFVHVLHNLPFGPVAMTPNPAFEDVMERIDSFVTTSRFAADYLRALTDKPVRVVYPQAREPNTKRGGNSATLINPSVWKGIDIFLALADRCPDLPFLAVPGWGTTPKDRHALAARSNIEVIEWQADVDEIWARTRVLLAPSVWAENFGMVALEAGLAGIPVLASDQGGLPEATLGVRAPISVRPLQMPAKPGGACFVPPQDVAEWEGPLRNLMQDSEIHTACATAVRDAAHEFVATTKWSDRDLWGLIAGIS